MQYFLLNLAMKINMYVLFQAKVGREKEFQLALRSLRGRDVDISHEAAEILVHSKLIDSLQRNFKTT